jgi:hypothetical protein
LAPITATKERLLDLADRLETIDAVRERASIEQT